MDGITRHSTQDLNNEHVGGVVHVGYVARLSNSKTSFAEADFIVEDVSSAIVEDV